jgi:hypothetical protein
MDGENLFREMNKLTRSFYIAPMMDWSENLSLSDS